jgi:hypothetical protein
VAHRADGLTGSTPGFGLMSREQDRAQLEGRDSWVSQATASRTAIPMGDCDPKKRSRPRCCSSSAPISRRRCQKPRRTASFKVWRAQCKKLARFGFCELDRDLTLTSTNSASELHQRVWREGEAVRLVKCVSATNSGSIRFERPQQSPLHRQRRRGKTRLSNSGSLSANAPGVRCRRRAAFAAGTLPRLTGERILAELSGIYCCALRAQGFNQAARE